MAGNDVPAEFVAHLERTLEVNACTRCQAPTVVTRRVSAAASTANQARLPSFPRPTTVKQTPLQAIDAPIAIVSRIVATSDLELGQPFRARLDREHFADVVDDTSASHNRSNI